MVQHFENFYVILFFTDLLSQNTNRQDLPSRAPLHMSLLSPPSKDIHAELRNGPTSRNPLPAFPTYSSDSGVREPAATTSYSSIHRTNELPGRRSPIRFQGLSSIPSASSFDDSLEVGGTSRLSRNESRPTSSLGLRPVIANNSGVFIVENCFFVDGSSY